MFDNENDANRDNNYANNRDHNKHDNTKTIMTIDFIIKEIQSVYVSSEKLILIQRVQVILAQVSLLDHL